ncbi:MAG TPA: alkaline phosphatase family protein [Gemmatimonadales bacterium]|nr:alkaline phosphatase family protein [Gemmatimonadales bacterium]
MILSAVLALALAGGHAAPPAASGPVHPKLVVVITVDQLRPDYLDRWKGQLTGGFATLRFDGADFTDAFQDHAVTETAPGHATILAGRWPAHTGIIRNSQGVQDSTAPLIGVAGPGASPLRFRGTSFFAWLKAADTTARALSVSRKDRGAILPLGRARESVFWYQSGLFTTSRYYADSLPAWVKTFNALRVPFRAAGAAWQPLLPDSAYPELDSEPWENGGTNVRFPHTLPADSARAAEAYVGMPSMDSLTLAFALAGADAMKLGKRDATDLLAVSLSTTDAVGHAFGPDSKEIHDQVLRLDRYLAWFLGRLFDRYGKGNLLIVLTADHGVTPFPEVSRQKGHPDARRVDVDSIVSDVNARLAARLGDPSPRRYFDFDTGMLILEDNGRLAAAGVRVDSVVADVASRLRGVPGVARVSTPADIATADTAADPVARRWLHHVPPDAGVQLMVTLHDFDIWGSAPIAEHGQPSDVDAHVPLILWGKGVRKGVYAARANAVDIAPTLARLLGLTPFSLLDGRVLTEAIEP